MKLPPNPAQWWPPWDELFAERAAIVEFTANVSRAEAERFAENDIRNQANRESGVQEELQLKF